MEHNKEEITNERVVIIHGFTKEEIFSVMRAVKREMGVDSDIAFAMTTPKSVEMKLEDLIKDVREEHTYLKKNPPKRVPTE